MGEKILDTDNSELAKYRHRFETTLRGVREEFDDHRESINDNTNEIQANYEYITKLDEKLRKVEERLDQLENWMARTEGMTVQQDEERQITLNEKEKSVFLMVYTAAESVTYRQLAESMDENEFLIRGYVTNMLEKGVPIQKRYSGSEVFLSLDGSFKDRQAKHNIVGISQRTVREFLM